ncbi:glycosyltransferase family 4 protein [Gloeobacter violaceus]|uniref:Glr0459 protein n=1 Tax=Gloeobacter violaceus (strain ATCC 29082 / PCC 7421) TaxID=251221 RepID=Q7NNF2_GLOVI|nr:glycosyltransferase family 4 protein [Gloeobacter violaceus]BAC88400.1 glr0459 [Gloeobacter violaceus PCC 7421]
MLTQKQRADGRTRERYRVALIHTSAGVIWSGGSEIFAIEMSRRLSEYFDVELLSGEPCGPLSTPVGAVSRTRSRAVFRHPLLAPLWRRFTNVPELWWEYLTGYFPTVSHLLRKPADLVFPINGLGGLAAAWTVRALIGTPLLYTEHCGLLRNGRDLRRSLDFRPDRLIALSTEIAEFARRHRPQQPVAVIPNGIDLARFRPEGECIELGLPAPVVLCVASLRKDGHKRVNLAIEAVSRLPGVSLLICGDGLDRPYYSALAERLLGAGRSRIDSFPFEQMPAVYRSCQAFTLPSVDEPWGLAYVEAMASGLGVVATDDAMRRHIVADAGLLCDVTDIDTYARCLRQVLAENWQERALRSSRRFGWDRLAIDYRDAIVETIQVKQTASKKAAD